MKEVPLKKKRSETWNINLSVGIKVVFISNLWNHFRGNRIINKFSILPHISCRFQRTIFPIWQSYPCKSVTCLGSDNPKSNCRDEICSMMYLCASEQAEVINRCHGQAQNTRGCHQQRKPTDAEAAVVGDLPPQA